MFVFACQSPWCMFSMPLCYCMQEEWFDFMLTMVRAMVSWLLRSRLMLTRSIWSMHKYWWSVQFYIDPFFDLFEEDLVVIKANVDKIQFINAPAVIGRSPCWAHFLCQSMGHWSLASRQPGPQGLDQGDIWSRILRGWLDQCWTVWSISCRSCCPASPLWSRSPWCWWCCRPCCKPQDLRSIPWTPRMAQLVASSASISSLSWLMIMCWFTCQRSQPRTCFFFFYRVKNYSEEEYIGFWLKAVNHPGSYEHVSFHNFILNCFLRLTNNAKDVSPMTSLTNSRSRVATVLCHFGLPPPESSVEARK